MLGHATIRNFVRKIRSTPDRDSVLGDVLATSVLSQVHPRRRACRGCRGKEVEHVQLPCHDNHNKQDKNNVRAMSYQCPGHVLGQSAMSWLCFAVIADLNTPRFTQDTARTWYLPWPNHVTWGFPLPERGHIHHGTLQEINRSSSSVKKIPNTGEITQMLSYDSNFCWCLT